jgi:hypothetical protein
MGYMKDLDIRLAARVVMPDGRHGWIVAWSCQEPILVGVKTDDGRYVAVKKEELTPAS